MSEKKIIWIGLFPPQVPNVGDHAMIIAIQKWFEDNFPNWEVIRFYRHIRFGRREDWDRLLKTVKKDDLVFIHSGGDFGTFYWTGEEKYPWHKTRRKIILSFPNNKIIQLPVTVFYHNTKWGKIILEEEANSIKVRKNIILMCRDPKSYEILANAYVHKSFFVPDFAFYLKPDLVKKERKGALLILRKDAESRFNQEKNPKIILKLPKEIRAPLCKLVTISSFVFTRRAHVRVKTMVEKVISNVTVKDVQVAGYPITDKNRESCINRTLDYYQSFKVVITDRLHGMIFSVITKTPCIAIDGRIPHKLSGYKKLLSRSVKFVKNIEEIPNAMREVLSKPYQETDITSYFTTLKEKIFNIFNSMEKIDMPTKKDSE